MKKVFQKVVVAFAAAGMVLPVQAMAETQAPVGKTAPAVTDVALTAGGTLNGAVVSPEGRPQPGTKVQVLHKGRVVAAAKTAEDGRYSIKGLRNGVHTVKVDQVSSTYRFWAENTAPPTARKGAVIVPSSEISRGQLGGNGGLLALGAFGAVTAVTFATTVGNDDKPSSP